MFDQLLYMIWKIQFSGENQDLPSTKFVWTNQLIALIDDSSQVKSNLFNVGLIQTCQHKLLEAFSTD